MIPWKLKGYKRSHSKYWELPPTGSQADPEGACGRLLWGCDTVEVKAAK